MKICMINGSPKSKDSSSEYLIDEITKLLDSKLEVTVCSAKDKPFSDEQFSNIYSCDAIVFAFPLYVDAIPSHLISFLQAFQEYLSEKPVKNTRVYAVSNCGFFEGEQNRYALNIIENYCERTGLIWEFGVGIGAGGFIGGSKSIPWESSIKKPVYKELLKLKGSLETGEEQNQNIFITAKMPRRFYILAAHRGWKSLAKKNSLKIKDLYAE